MKDTILVIEDNDDIRGLLVNTLTIFGFDVETAANGPEGLRMAQETRPDLILSDIMLPYYNGYEVYKRLRDHGIVPVTPFIFLTALDSPNDVRNGLLLGADDYIVKPFEPAHLVKTIREMLNRASRQKQAPFIRDKRYDIFISYSHRDRKLMHDVRQLLQSANFEVWTDELLEEGDDWEEAIEDAIRNTSYVVPLLTERSAQSRWVRRELSYAELNRTRILPLLLRGNADTSMPLRLVDLQFIDGRRDFSACVNRLIRALRERLGIIDE